MRVKQQTAKHSGDWQPKSQTTSAKAALASEQLAEKSICSTGGLTLVTSAWCSRSKTSLDLVHSQLLNFSIPQLPTQMIIDQIMMQVCEETSFLTSSSGLITYSRIFQRCIRSQQGSGKWLDLKQHLMNDGEMVCSSSRKHQCQILQNQRQGYVELHCYRYFVFSHAWRDCSSTS